MTHGHREELPAAILIAGDIFNYPEGLAAAARIHAFAAGFLKAGHRPLVLRLGQPSPGWGSRNPEGSGTYEGIPFLYTHGSSTPHPGFFIRQWLTLLDPARYFWAARSHFVGSQRRAILLYSERKVLLLATFALCILLGAVFVQDISEYPRVYHRKTLWRKLETQLYLRFFFKLPDAFVTISGLLEDLARRFGRASVRVLRIPILVEPEAFVPPARAERSGRYRVLYSGTLDHPGEVSGLLEIVAEAAKVVPEIRLTILGGSESEETVATLKRLADELGIGEITEFAGLVPRREVPSVLIRAGVLVLPRLAALFSQAGFPTKLAEYLATGRPVVATTTGEIPNYLEDRVSAFLVPAGDPHAFARTLSYVLTHEEEGAQVGRRGREVALEHFDSTKNCRRITEMILELHEQMK